ncbi:MAG: hypothetical protein Q4A42_03145 [Tissierellia bacterium]|nr:hypothetical protein [Tissierellia bacterium]
MKVIIELDSAEMLKTIETGSLYKLGLDLKDLDFISKSPEEPSEPEKAEHVNLQTPTPTVTTTVPTSAKTYTQDELSRAAIGLMDLGKQDELINLLNNVFGVVSIPELQKEKYSEFANKLRELGANI